VTASTVYIAERTAGVWSEPGLPLCRLTYPLVTDAVVMIYFSELKFSRAGRRKSEVLHSRFGLH